MTTTWAIVIGIGVSVVLFAGIFLREFIRQLVKELEAGDAARARLRLAEDQLASFRLAVEEITPPCTETLIALQMIQDHLRYGTPIDVRLVGTQLQRLRREKYAALAKEFQQTAANFARPGGAS